jgi:5-methylthioadenosine/S-adenosylhomocysteine deaminase
MRRVETILTGGFVLTMNETLDAFPRGAVAISGDSIIAVGPAEDILAHFAADEVVLCEGQVIMPGLINTHTHAPMTLLRGLADDLRLDVWLMGYMMPTEQQFVNSDFCRLGTLLACAEMIRSGVTAFADMYYYEADVAAAAAAAGMRALCAQTVLKFPTPDAPSYDDGLKRTRQFIEAWKDHPLIVPAVGPHAPYTCTDEMLKACAGLAVEYDVPLHIHIAETKLEVDDSLAEFGMFVVPRVEKNDILRAKVLAAHCVHINYGEIRTLVRAGAGIAHCPTSNLKLASGIAPVVEMLKQKANVGIGTDGPASNNDLDMFEEIRLAAILAKGATLDPVVVPAKQALVMATRLGAAAMHMADITGSLVAGKRADVIVVNLNTLHNTPTFQRDPDALYSQVVYAAKSTDVQHVIVNGKWLMRDRALLTIDEQTVMRDANVIARQIDTFLSAREGNVLHKLLAIGGVERDETFEIQVKAQIEDATIVELLFASPHVEVIKHTHYRQYDTYFVFADAHQGRIRYREDDAINADGEVDGVRTRLTFTLPTKEREFDDAVMLSRSQFIAPATRPLRFYREYFRPTQEREVQKKRLRWHIHYKGVLFYVNVDTIQGQKGGQTYLEIKSQTWSQADAEFKARLVRELLDALHLTPEMRVRQEYLELTGTKV